MHRADRLRRRLGLALLAACLGPGGARAQGPALDLAGLMQRMAQRKGGTARFTEERNVSGIDGPLHASGVLSYTAPDRFTRQTLHPVPESMEVQGRTLVIRRSGRTRQMELDGAPELGAVLDAMRATLTGDLALLQKHFRVVFSGTEAQWLLRLSPLAERLARQVQQIEIVGQGADLRSIELRLTGGDRSLMLIDPLVSTPPAR